MISKIMRFGELELKLMFELEQRKNFIFTIKDAKRILGSSAASVRNVIKRLKRKKRVIPLQKGVYLFAPLKSGKKGLWSEHAFAVVPYLVGSSKYYIGFISAMNYWGMTEQIPIVVYVALERQKKSLEAVQTEFIFVKKHKLGEFETLDFSGVKVAISTKEQTIIDALAFPEYCLGIIEVAKAIYSSRKELDFDRLISLAKKEKKIVQMRLGYLMDLLRLKTHTKRLEEKFVWFGWLDPNEQKNKFTYSKKWKLKLNISERDLMNFMEVY